MSNAAIAAKLNERRVPTAQGGVWTQVQMRGCYWGEPSAGGALPGPEAKEK